MINKSNQFNLTTRRRSAAEVAALMADDPVAHPHRLADRPLWRQRPDQRALAKVEGDALMIDTWLMSCRVLKRGVETLLEQQYLPLGRRRGLRRICGEYIATAKNDLVREHYAGLGYAKISDDGNGHARWEMPLAADWRPQSVSIEEQGVR